MSTDKEQTRLKETPPTLAKDPLAPGGARTDQFDFELPEGRIARVPNPTRDASRLLVLDRAGAGCLHEQVRALPGLLRSGDLLVFNDTRVIPARLVGVKPTGGRVELLLVEPEGLDGPEQVWRALYTASKPVRPGVPLRFSAEAPGGEDALEATLEATLEAALGDGMGRFTLRARGGVRAAIQRVGALPLPPYLGRAPDAADAERYQTVFARVEGAVAAPTAGLHFTPALLAALDDAGVRRATVTLHVGPGTFLPVRVDNLDEHRMHEEPFDVPEATAALVADTKAQGGRVIAVGTTSLRTLEAAADSEAPGRVLVGRGRTALFIRPGYKFRTVDALFTNFHLPRSTLLMLVCALAGQQRVLAAYVRLCVRSTASTRMAMRC